MRSEFAGACDTHMHFYDARYPTSPQATLQPPDATVDDYRLVQQTLGLERVVVVQPTTYGLDNSCQLDAMALIGEAARGVVVVDGSVTADELRSFTAAGVRGARFHMLPGGAVGWDQLAPVAELIAPFGWHIQLQLDGHELAGRLDQLRSLPCPLVVDHVGRFMPPTSPDSEAFGALLQLVDDGAHVKLSAPYESALDATHAYATVTACVDALVERAPDRLLWATNWPHPGQADPPSLERLAALRDKWLPTDELRRQVLVVNPAALYDFG